VAKQVIVTGTVKRKARRIENSPHCRVRLVGKPMTHSLYQHLLKTRIRLKMDAIDEGIRCKKMAMAKLGDTELTSYFA